MYFFIGGLGFVLSVLSLNIVVILISASVLALTFLDFIHINQTLRNSINPMQFTTSDIGTQTMPVSSMDQQPKTQQAQYPIKQTEYEITDIPNKTKEDQSNYTGIPTNFCGDCGEKIPDKETQFCNNCSNSVN